MRLEKANMMLLSKELTDKDRSMKTQLLIRSQSSDDEKLSGEKVWKENGFFKDIRPELNLEKVNMPENCLYYVNQAFLSTVKDGDIANVCSKLYNWSIDFCSESTKRHFRVYMFTKRS